LKTYPDSNVVPAYSTMLGLADRGFIVFGAGEGIGRQACHALSQVGARVVCVDRDAALAERVAEEVQGFPATADVTQRAELERVFALADEGFGSSFSGIVDIVGMAQIGRIVSIDDDAWSRQFDIVLRHVYLTLQLAGPRLQARGGGTMVYVGSISGMVSVPSQAAYGTAKAALHHLVRCAAHELGPTGIRVNAIAPGVVRTPRLLKGLDEEFWRRLSDLNPLRRVAIPAEIAAAILFLASDLSSYVTGNVLTLDGGVSNVAVIPDFRLNP
jgi:NAD(P)-dependent dehydrogenase (short-subunit alcohol dehydrogenase family)